MGGKKRHLLHLANCQEHDPIAKGVMVEVTAAHQAKLQWSATHNPQQYGRVGGLISQPGEFTAKGRQHFNQLLARLHNTLQSQPNWTTKYPTLGGLIDAEQSEEAEEFRKLAYEQVYMWFGLRMRQRQQGQSKGTAGECVLRSVPCSTADCPLSQHLHISMLAGGPSHPSPGHDMAVPAEGGEPVLCSD